MRFSGLPRAAVLGLVLTAAASAWHAPGDTSVALAASGTSGSLVRGGTVRGDISLDAADADRIAIDLVEGSTFTARFTSNFAADVAFSGPGGAIDLGWGTGNRRNVRAWKVLATGRHEFVVRAAGGQGVYTLTASARFAPRMSLPGTSGGTVRWAMPAGASVSGRVSAVPARSWDPVVDGVAGPSGAPLLAAPVTGARGAATLPKVTATADGAYVMSVSGGAAGGAFQAALKLAVPRTRPVRLTLTNGLTTVSFANDGVRALLAANCAGSSCHSGWIGSAATVKPHAPTLLQRVRDGSMPMGRPPLQASEIDLLQRWISTGMKP